jgi:hypothetical protein
MKTLGIFRTPYYAVLPTNTSSNANPLFISKEKSVKVHLASFFAGFVEEKKYLHFGR